MESFFRYLVLQSVFCVDTAFDRLVGNRGGFHGISGIEKCMIVKKIKLNVL
jgi:hypothetical protein